MIAEDNLRQLFLLKATIHFETTVEDFFACLEWDGLVGELSLLHFALRLEDGCDELKNAQRIEYLKLRRVLVKLNWLHGEHVVDQAEQKVELRNDQVDSFLRRYVEPILLEHLL